MMITTNTPVTMEVQPHRTRSSRKKDSSRKNGGSSSSRSLKSNRGRREKRDKERRRRRRKRMQSRQNTVEATANTTFDGRSLWEVEFQRQLCRLALPTMVERVLTKLQWFLTLHILGYRTSSVELAAAALASTLANVLGISVIIGMCSGITTLVGQARGTVVQQGKSRRSRRSEQQQQQQQQDEMEALEAMEIQELHQRLSINNDHGTHNNNNNNSNNKDEDRYDNNFSSSNNKNDSSSAEIVILPTTKETASSNDDEWIPLVTTKGSSSTRATGEHLPLIPDTSSCEDDDETNNDDEYTNDGGTDDDDESSKISLNSYHSLESYSTNCSYVIEHVLAKQQSKRDLLYVYLYRGMSIHCIMALPMVMLWMIPGLVSKILVNYAGQDPTVAKLCERYLCLLAPGMWLFAIYNSLATWLQAIELAHVPPLVTLVAVALHPFVLYTLVDLVGYDGAAYAATFFLGIRPILLVLYLISPQGQQSLQQKLNGGGKSSSAHRNHDGSTTNASTTATNHNHHLHLNPATAAAAAFAAGSAVVDVNMTIKRSNVTSENDGTATPTRRPPIPSYQTSPSIDEQDEQQKDVEDNDEERNNKNKINDNNVAKQEDNVVGYGSISSAVTKKDDITSIEVLPPPVPQQQSLDHPNSRNNNNNHHHNQQNTKDDDDHHSHVTTEEILAVATKQLEMTPLDTFKHHLRLLLHSLHSWHGVMQYLSLSLPGLVLISEWWASEVSIFLSAQLTYHGDDNDNNLDSNGISTATTTAALASAVPLAAFSIYQNLNTFTFSAAQGFGVAASTRVSNELGSQNVAGAKLSAQVSIISSTCTGLLLCILLLSIPHTLLPSWYDPNPLVYELCAQLIPWLSVYVIGDGIAFTLTGILKGCGKQQMVAPIVLIAYWLIGVPLGIIFTFTKHFFWSTPSSSSSLSWEHDEPSQEMPNNGVVGVNYNTYNSLSMNGVIEFRQSLYQNVTGLVAGLTIGTFMHMFLLSIVVWNIDWNKERRDARLRIQLQTKAQAKARTTL